MGTTSGGSGPGRTVNKEAHMTVRARILRMIAASAVLLGVSMVMPFLVDADAGKKVVMGVVERARGDEVTVDGKTYDLKGARFRDGYGVPLKVPPDLRGTTIELLIRNRKIEFVTVYPTLPQ
jgi:hypothetical protein